MARKSTTRGDVMQLTLAHGVEAGMQLLVPLVLVRIFSRAEFGEYRLFWLVANTLMLFVPLGVSRSLLYFLPRTAPEERGTFVAQTVLYFTAISVPIAAVLVFGTPWLPENIATLTEPVWVLGAFAFFYLVSSILEVLPNADRNIPWQKRAIISMAVIRTLIIVGLAFSTEDLQAVFAGLLIFVALQTAVLGYYVLTRHGRGLRWPTAAGMKRQLGYAIPFGLSNVLSRARRHLEQWIVVFLFATEALAVLSIALSFSQILNLFRTSVGNVLLPKMSKTHAGGDISRSLNLNNRGNLSICFLIFPFVAYIWTFAPSLVEFLYTSAYVEAVPVVRVYALNMLLTSVELATVLMIYEQGRFVAKVSLGVLLGAGIASYAGAIWFGLPGVALGGLLGTAVTRLLNFNRAARLLGVRFRELQDWATLGRMLLAAAVAGAAAFVLTRQFLPDLPNIPTLIAGAALGGAAYAVLMFVLKFDWVPLAMLGRRPWPE